MAHPLQNVIKVIRKVRSLCGIIIIISHYSIMSKFV
jgi:hypothetical protein